MLVGAGVGDLTGGLKGLQHSPPRGGLCDVDVGVGAAEFRSLAQKSLELMEEMYKFGYKLLLVSKGHGHVGAGFKVRLDLALDLS